MARVRDMKFIPKRITTITPVELLQGASLEAKAAIALRISEWVAKSRDTATLVAVLQALYEHEPDFYTGDIARCLDCKTHQEAVDADNE